MSLLPSQKVLAGRVEGGLRQSFESALHCTFETQLVGRGVFRAERLGVSQFTSRGFGGVIGRVLSTA